MRTIYNPECYSLYTDNVEDKECLKRYFVARDYLNSSDLRIAVCAEYFRHVYHKYANEKYTSHYFSIKKTIIETVGKYVPLMEYDEGFRSTGNRGGQSFENIRILLPFLERPFFHNELTLITCFNFIIENPGKAKEVRSRCANALIEWSNKKDTLKKDQKIKELIKDSFELEVRKGKFYPSWGQSEVNEIKFLELITHLFNKL